MVLYYDRQVLWKTINNKKSDIKIHFIFSLLRNFNAFIFISRVPFMISIKVMGAGPLNI